jgi:hypothetical protein
LRVGGIAIALAEVHGVVALLGSVFGAARALGMP